MTQELVRIDPTKLVTSYQQGFSRLLPSHMREDGGGDQWVAAVKSLLATNPAIAAAASNSRDHFLASLIQAAPGSAWNRGRCPQSGCHLASEARTWPKQQSHRFRST